MTVKIKLTRNTGGHKAGDTITTTSGAAAHLIAAGYAEEAKTRASKKTTDDADH